MNSKIKTFLKLTRIPAVFTAQSDIIAAFILAGTFSPAYFSKLFAILTSSTGLYMAGMVLNDYFDLEIDKVTRPQRPLPSGELDPSTAILFASLLVAVSIACAYYAGRRSFVISLMLLFFILLYDMFAKKMWVVGSLSMGMCRFLNFLLGLSLVAIRLWPCVLIACINFCYVVGINFVSRGETGSRQGKALLLGILTFLVNLTLVFVITSVYAQSTEIYNGAIVYYLFFIIVILGNACLMIKKSADAMKRMVGKLVLGIIVLNALHVLVFSSVPDFFVVISLLIPGMVLAKLIPVS